MCSLKMRWQFHFFFFLRGSLLCVVGSSLYRSGVQHNVPMSSFAAADCVPCHESPYGSTLNSQDIKSCVGPYLFVGIQKEDRSALEFGALASVEVLRMDASKSAPYLSNGVYWHFTKGCSFGFEAFEHNLNDKDEESSRSLVSTNRGASWSIDHSIDCTSPDDFTIHTLIDTSKWRKHIFNCPEYPASVLLSEKEEERGKEHREISAIHVLSPPTPCAGSGSQATLYTSQEFAISPAPSIQPLLVAVTSSIKTISNVSDLVVSLKNSWKKSNNVTYLEYIVVLKETKYRSALVRLNASISSNTFSSTLSRALGTAVTVKGSYSRYSGDPTTDIKDPSTLNANMLWFAIVPLLIASVVGYQCYKHVLHMALEQEQARARARASQYEGGSGSGSGSAVHVSASGTTFMPYNSNQLPSAEATLVSQGSPATYEMATAVVTTSKIV